MKPKFEEKTFESYFNNELDQKSSIYFPFGQVQEGGIGADAAAHSRNWRLWRRLGYPFSFRAPFEGEDLTKISQEMESLLGREISNIPPIKANLLFQYKRPEVIASPQGAEWPHWRRKYFRYDIDQDQHRLLTHIEVRFGAKALVLYASPAVEDVNELVRLKRSRQIVENTNFRKASELTGHSRNTYVKAGTHSIACSDPVRHERYDLLEYLRHLPAIPDMSNEDVIVEFCEGVRLSAQEDEAIGSSYRMVLQEYSDAGFSTYPLLYANISLFILREVSGLQWLAATSQ